MTYEIEDGVPLPDGEGRGGRPTIYPLADLEVGQSFFAAGKSTSNLSSAWNTPGVKRLGREFTSQSTVENGVEGVRVWRIA